MVVSAGPPRVFVVQEPPQVPRSTGGTRPKIDLSPCERRFGKLIYCLEWSETKEMTPGAMFARLADRLRDYRKEDYLLFLGHPAAMTMAAVIALTMTEGVAKLIWWDRENRSYSVWPLDMNTLTEEWRTAP